MGIFVSRRLFRHLKYQDLYTGDAFIYISGLMFLVLFLATREAVVPLEIVLSCSGHQYSSYDTIEINIYPIFFQISSTEK